MISRKLWIPVTTFVIGGLVLAACAPRASTPTAAQTAQVTALTATTSVETSGTIQPLQSASLSWKTTGQVASVNVKVGDTVKAGDVLMTLEPTSAPQNIIQAQADLITAQEALDNLLYPGALEIASGQKAVADAQDALETAQRDLRNTLNPDIAYYEDQVRQKQEALLQAQQNVEKTNLGSLNTALQNAKDALEHKTDQLNDARSAQAACPDCVTVFATATGRRIELKDAEKEYEDALNAYRVAELNLQQAQMVNDQALQDVQEGLADAQANLAAAKAGADAVTIAQKETAVAVAEANLADAQKTLDDLLNGGASNEIAAAQARVLAARATVDMLTLKAPFDGEVLAINHLPGDLVSQSTVAVVLANRSSLHVDVSVDEADITGIQVGDPVQVTFDPLADLTLEGVVAQINPLGEEQQGLVKYTVRVDLTKTDPRVLLGMTANVNIITDVQENALAVPIEAVQLDDAGEYVNRVRANGAVERVSVTSGQTQDDLVVVTGALSPGDVVQIPAPQPQQPQGPFGGG